MQGVRTASELALQLRKLDGHIQWEALKRPIMEADNPFASAEVLERRRQPAPSLGWEYLVQMPPVEAPSGLGFGANSSIRQPLQPLTAVPGQMVQGPQQQLQQQQQLISKQKLPAQLLGQAPASQHGQQQQQRQAAQLHQQPAQLPNQALSMLSNDTAQQQQQRQQQAFSAEEAGQIGDKQTVSTLSGTQLPQQLPTVAESAGRHDPSVVPEQGQAGLQNDVATKGMNHFGDASTSVPFDASKPLEPHAAATQLQGVSYVKVTSSVPNGSQMSNSDQHLNGIQPGMVHGNLSQHVEAPIEVQVNGATQQPSASPSSQCAQPAPTPTPFLTQQLPKQANSLSSLVPHQQQYSALSSTSLQPLGPFSRPQGQNLVAGPSREGSPMPKGPPSWVHESQLPLWLVRTFEEKRRRDIAMVAARAAQQAQREANTASRGLGNLAQPWRFECKVLLWLIHFHL